MTEITYKIIPNAGLKYEVNDTPDDYVGLQVYLDGEPKTMFTGFLDESLLRDLLSGKGKDIRDT